MNDYYEDIHEKDIKSNRRWRKSEIERVKKEGSRLAKIFEQKTDYPTSCEDTKKATWERVLNRFKIDEEIK